jgi:hypothetical protein
MTKISHIKYCVTTLLSHVCMLLMGTTTGHLHNSKPCILQQAYLGCKPDQRLDVAIGN